MSKKKWTSKELDKVWDDSLPLFENLKKVGMNCPYCNGEIIEDIDEYERHKIFCKDCGKVIARCL